VRFTVAGVWRDYARQQGAIAIERERYTALTGDDTVTNAALWLAPGTGADDVRAALARALPGGDRLELAMPGEIRSASLAVFDRTFAVTYAPRARRGVDRAGRDVARSRRWCSHGASSACCGTSA
jgi:putative ABC transport system permease protein